MAGRFGLFTVDFDLTGNVFGVGMRFSGWKCLSFPLPMALLPRNVAMNEVEEGHCHFNVAIALPSVKLVLHHQGWLVPDAPRDPAAP